MKRNSFIGTTLLAVGLACSFSAQANQLDNIKAKKKLVCGTFGAISPFGFPDPKTRETVGHDVDLCKAIAKEMGVEAVIRGYPVGAHIPEIKLGHIDIIIANMGYTQSRAKQVDFSNAYNVFKEVVSVNKDSGITSFDQLAGKKLSSTKGSTSEQAIRLKLTSATPMTFQDAAAAFLALQQGKVDGFVINNVSAANFAVLSANSPKPSVVLDQTLYLQPVAIGVKQGEPELLAEVNTILGKLESSGYMQQAWDKWIGANTDLKLVRTYKTTPIKDIDFQPMP
jgi:polar amino acid transport system substrate-binding protein